MVKPLFGSARPGELADRRTFVIDWVEHVLGSASARSKVAKWSYCHPNGFFKIPLDFSSLGGAFYRIHLWTGEHKLPDYCSPTASASDIHNHPWEFTSAVLFGALVHETFEKNDEEQESSDAQFLSELVFRMSVSPGENYCETNKKLVAIYRTNSRILKAGTVYSLGPDILHRIYPVLSAKINVVSLVKQGPLQRSATTAYRGLEDGRPYSTQWDRLSDCELREVLDIVRNLLLW